MTTPNTPTNTIGAGIDLRPMSARGTRVHDLREYFNEDRPLNREELGYFIRSQRGELTKEDSLMQAAMFHILFINEVAIQAIFELLDAVKRSRYYRHEVKRKANELRRLLLDYRHKVDTTMTGTIDREMHRLEGFANMNDYIDSILGPVLKKTTYAVRLSLGHQRVNEDALMAQALMAMKVAKMADEVHEAEVQRTININGGLMARSEWTRLAEIAYRTYELTHLLAVAANSIAPDDFDIGDDPAVRAGISEFVKKMCNGQILADAIQSAKEADTEPGEATEAAAL